MSEATKESNVGAMGEASGGSPTGDADRLDTRSDFEQVKLLFDYTKFHIGVYTTVAASLIAFTNTEVGERILLPEPLIWLAVAFVAVAGLAGGIVASTLPHCRTLEEFWSRPVGPFRIKALPGEAWTYIEHSAFWLAVFATILAFNLRGGTPPADKPLQPTSASAATK